MLTKYIKCIPHVDDIDDVNFIIDMIEFVWKHKLKLYSCVIK